MKKRIVLCLLLGVISLNVVACGSSSAEVVEQTVVETQMEIETEVESTEVETVEVETEEEVTAVEESTVEEVETEKEEAVEVSGPIVTAMEATMYVNNSTLNVSAQATKDSEKLGVVSFGDELKVTGKADNGWFQIALSDGSTGYVSGSYVSETKPEPKPVETPVIAYTPEAPSNPAPEAPAAPANNGQLPTNVGGYAHLAGSGVTRLDNDDTGKADELINIILVQANAALHNQPNPYPGQGWTTYDAVKEMLTYYGTPGVDFAVGNFELTGQCDMCSDGCGYFASITFLDPVSGLMFGGYEEVWY